jgi:predicted alpha/beta-hydrolase family hydrolase
VYTQTDVASRLAVLAPGYGGGPDQRILQQLRRRLGEAGFESRAVAFRTQGTRPSQGYTQEIDDLRAVRDFQESHAIDAPRQQLALVGRSFGGRICTFLAVREPPTALVVLGYPIAPSGKPRPGDEAALADLTCPTLIVQGDRDELGPLEVLAPIVRSNSNIHLYVVAGAAHSYGRREGEAIEAAVSWLVRTMP